MARQLWYSETGRHEQGVVLCFDGSGGGEEPRIMDTFVEAYDFSGKTVVPFCTSGGSGFGLSGKNMQSLSKGDATWLDGERLSSLASREDMMDWINGLGLDVEAKLNGRLSKEQLTRKCFFASGADGGNPDGAGSP